jgi:aquaporin NIP
MTGELTRKLCAEFFGTFCLVFAGTGAIIVNDVTGGTVTHVGVAMTFGLIVFAMIAAVGDVSGAHLNPAVTLGLSFSKRFPGRLVAPYIAAQLAGALSASLVLRGLFPDHLSLGGTVPSGTAGQSFGLEILLTLILMFVILAATAGPNVNKLFVALAVGGVVGLEAMFAGPICGASMNPARSVGPAIVAWQLNSLWIYLLAPTVGAIAAVPLCRCVREARCCRALEGVAT